MSKASFRSKATRLFGISFLIALLIVVGAVSAQAGLRQTKYKPTNKLVFTKAHYENVKQLIAKVHLLGLSDRGLENALVKTAEAGLKGNVSEYLAAARLAEQKYSGLNGVVQLQIREFVAATPLTRPVPDPDPDDGCANSCSMNCRNGYMFICCPVGSMCTCSCDVLGYPRCTC